jgi:hypothetical protein
MKVTANMNKYSRPRICLSSNKGIAAQNKENNVMTGTSDRVLEIFHRDRPFKEFLLRKPEAGLSRLSEEASFFNSHVAVQKTPSAFETDNYILQLI